MRRHIEPIRKCFCGTLLLVSVVLILASAGFSGTIIQTVNSLDSTTARKNAVWDTPAAAPAGTDDYAAASGFFRANNTDLGLNVTGRMLLNP